MSATNVLLQFSDYLSNNFLFHIFDSSLHFKGYITSSGEKNFSMCFCNLNVSHCNMIFTINEPTVYQC